MSSILKCVWSDGGSTQKSNMERGQPSHCRGRNCKGIIEFIAQKPDPESVCARFTTEDGRQPLKNHFAQKE
jgi:hypothetical protein